jgi:hypothetical protein
VIVREVGSGAICVQQVAHAAIAGQIARAWGNAAFGAPAPREALEIAAARHDDGMRDFDDSPSLDPATGLPHTYLTMPRDTHLDSWERGTTALAEVSPYAAVLVSLHRTELLLRHRGSRLGALLDRGNRAHLRWQRKLRTRLLDGLRADPAWARLATPELLERNRRLLRSWDRTSLNLCVPMLPSTVRDVPAAEGTEDVVLSERDGTVTVDPWPFSAQQVEVRAEGRLLERRFDDEDEMLRTLREAPIRTLSFALRPAEKRFDEADR